MFEKIAPLIMNLPIINLLPIANDIVQFLPKAWAGLSDDEKEKIITNVLKLAAKAQK